MCVCVLCMHFSATWSSVLSVSNTHTHYREHEKRCSPFIVLHMIVVAVVGVVILGVVYLCFSSTHIVDTHKSRFECFLTQLSLLRHSRFYNKVQCETKAKKEGAYTEYEKKDSHIQCVVKQIDGRFQVKK